jgi:hypothetical protein
MLAQKPRFGFLLPYPSASFTVLVKSLFLKAILSCCARDNAFCVGSDTEGGPLLAVSLTLFGLELEFVSVLVFCEFGAAGTSGAVAGGVFGAGTVFLVSFDATALRAGAVFFLVLEVVASLLVWSDPRQKASHDQKLRLGLPAEGFFSELGVLALATGFLTLALVGAAFARALFFCLGMAALCALLLTVGVFATAG